MSNQSQNWLKVGTVVMCVVVGEGLQYNIINVLHDYSVCIEVHIDNITIHFCCCARPHNIFICGHGQGTGQVLRTWSESDIIIHCVLCSHIKLSKQSNTRTLLSAE